MQNIYEAWGFTANPFDTTSLAPNELGRRLHVGRKSQMDAFLRRLHTAPKIPTVEGANGIGKTSLVNVASYSTYQDHLETGEGPLFILCDQSFQLTTDTSLNDFVEEVYLAVAQTLLRKARELEGPRAEGLRRASKPLDTWLNSPRLTSIQGALANIGGGVSHQTNTSLGFEKSGLRQVVRGLLDEMFPTPDSGGVICVIDNLELLQTSANARNLLEELRDPLLRVPGLRWVLCGALGIVYGIAESPRLEGLLHAPVEIRDLGSSHATEIHQSRVEAYSRNGQGVLPITAGDFQRLFGILRGNLRSVLSSADQFCQWVADLEEPESVRSMATNRKRELFATWLSDTSEKYLRAVQGTLRPRPWEVFERAIEIGGSFSPSDYKEFGASSMQALRPNVKDLEDVGLLRSVQGETDRRRRTISVQPKGWFVHYARHRRDRSR